MPDLLLSSIPAQTREVGELRATQLLLEAATQLAAANELATVMAAVRRAARQLAHADGVTFVLREGDHVHYADEDAISPLWKGRRFPVDACISGWAMEHRCAVVIEDIAIDDRIPQETYRTTFVKSLAMVPVRPEDPVAAIGAYWAHRHRATEGQVALLEALAGLASTALANVALQAELRAAVQARDELIGVASHELRTPVAALRLQLDRARRLLAAAAGPQEVHGAVERSLRSVGRLTRVVESLLDASRVTLDGLRLSPEPLELGALVRARASRLADLLDATVQVSGPEPVPGVWDRERLEQVIDVLLANAVKFGHGKPVEASVTLDGPAAALTVRDHGRGIPAEDQARIFGRFERAVSTRHYGGFGLGLWLARRAVEAHGGSIAVSSREGEGAAFTVRLPRYRP